MKICKNKILSILLIMPVLFLSYGCGSRIVIPEDAAKAKTFVEKAKIEINDKNFRIAIDDLKESIKSDPRNPEAHYYLAVTYILAKYPVDKIIKEFKNSVKIDPGFTKGNRELGIIYTNLGKYEKGMWYLKKAVRADPKDNISIENLGYAYYRQKKYELAEEQYKKAENIEPDSANLWNNFGLLYMDKQEMEKAQNAFMRSLSIKPKQSAPYEYMALIEKQSGDPGQAEHYKLMAEKYKK